MDNIARIAYAIAALAKTDDPEKVAWAYRSDRIADVRKAVKIARVQYGLSTEAEWAEDFLYAHRYYRLRQVEKRLDTRL